MKSAIVVQPALRAATVRHIGPYYEIGAAFADLSTAAAAADLGAPGAVLVGIFHDDPETTPAAALRSDAGLIVDEGTKVPATLIDATIPAGRYLHGRHVGSYEGLPAAWGAMLQQGLAEHGVQRATGAGYELYLNTPGTTATDDLITDIYIPVL